MPGNFLEQLKIAPILCDGAVGTLLYAKGIFINRCYDELNLSQPDLIREIHHGYLQSGAQIIETNTFGANSFRLERHGLADRVRDINLAGVKLAREEAKSFDVWIGGSVGPLGVRMNLWAKFHCRKHAMLSASRLQPCRRVSRPSSFGNFRLSGGDPPSPSSRT